MPLQSGRNWRDADAFSFLGRKEALGKVMTRAERGPYSWAIIGFLHPCKVRRTPASIFLAKEYIEQVERQGNKRDGQRAEQGDSDQESVGSGRW